MRTLINEKAPSLLGLFVLLVVIISLTTSSSGTIGTSAQTPTQAENDPTRTVSVSGVGEVQASPDSAFLNLGVQTEAESASQALEQNNAQMQSVLDTFEAAGIPSEKIQTTTIRISPRYDYDETRDTQTLIGYTVTNMVEVQFDDIDNLGILIDNSVQAGASTVENVRFAISNTAD